MHYIYGGLYGTRTKFARRDEWEEGREGFEATRQGFEHQSHGSYCLCEPVCPICVHIVLGLLTQTPVATFVHFLVYL